MDTITDDLVRIAAPPRHVCTVVVIAGVAASALDVGLRNGLANACVAFGMFAIVGVLFVDRGVQSAAGRALLGVSLLPPLMLMVRASPWLTAYNAVAWTALILGALLYGNSGSIFATSLGQWGHRLAVSMLEALDGWAIVAPWFAKVRARGRGRGARVVVATLIAAPFALVALILLAWSDAILGALLTPDIDVGNVFGHGVVVTIIATIVVGACAAARAEIGDVDRVGSFGAMEVITMLGIVTAVLGLFVVAQLVALTGAGDRLVRQAGLTPSEYARSGFFQLCVAGLVIVMLLALIARLASPATMRLRSVKTMGAIVPLLTVGLVVVSLRRMALYDAAFGLTMLRLNVVAAAIWMGLVLVMMAARNLMMRETARSSRHWIGGVALLVAVAITIAGDIGNAEAFVVRHNIARARHHYMVDLRYLATLSDDAVSALAEAYDRWSRPEILRDALDCSRHPEGVDALNLSVRTANQIRSRICPHRSARWNPVG